MTHQHKIKQTIALLRNFYLENVEAYHQGQELLPVFNDYTKKLAKIVPIKYHFDQKYDQNSLQSRQKFIIATNHIPTPFLVPIKSNLVYKKLEITRKDLPHQVLHPNFFRYLPVASFLLDNNVKPHILSHVRPGLLCNLSKGWGGIQIPYENNLDRTQFIKDQFAANPDSDKHALVIYPAGRDSHGFLHQYEYYLHRYQRGFAVIGQDLKLPILPISVGFDYHNMAYHVYIHRLIEYAEFKEKDAIDFASEVKAQIATGITKAFPKIKVYDAVD